MLQYPRRSRQTQKSGWTFKTLCYAFMTVSIVSIAINLDFIFEGPITMHLFPGEIPQLRQQVAEKDSEIDWLSQQLRNASSTIENLRRDNETAWKTVSDKKKEIESLEAELKKAQLGLIEINASVWTKTWGTSATGITFTDASGQDYSVPVSHGRCKITLPNYRDYIITIHYLGVVPRDCAANPHTLFLNATQTKIDREFHD